MTGPAERSCKNDAMTTWERKSGDVGDTIKPYLDGDVDISGFTGVNGTVINCETGQSIQLTGAMLSVAERHVRLDLSPWLDTAAKGSWDVLTHVLFGTNKITWPSTGADRIIVS